MLKRNVLDTIETAAYKPQVDLLGEKRTECGLGSYAETSIYDDWEGKLHCSECNHEVKRH